MSRLKEFRYRTKLRIGLVIAAGITIPLGRGLSYGLLPPGPASTFENPPANFKSGSCGHKRGFPYHLRQVMPEVSAALWNQRTRTNMWRHRDGSGNDLFEFLKTPRTPAPLKDGD